MPCNVLDLIFFKTFYKKTPLARSTQKMAMEETVSSTQVDGCRSFTMIANHQRTPPLHFNSNRNLTFYATHPASYWTSSKAFAIWWVEGRRIILEAPEAHWFRSQARKRYVRDAIPADLNKATCLLVKVEWLVEGVDDENNNGFWYDLYSLHILIHEIINIDQDNRSLTKVCWEKGVCGYWARQSCLSLGQGISVTVFNSTGAEKL